MQTIKTKRAIGCRRIIRFVRVISPVAVCQCVGVVVIFGFVFVGISDIVIVIAVTAHRNRAGNMINIVYNQRRAFDAVMRWLNDA